MSEKKTHPKIDKPFVPYTDELIASPVWQVLTASAFRLLRRVEIEHMRHGGQENGRLIVTYDQLEGYGISDHSIAPAIRECEALGLMKIARQGRAGNAEFRRAHWFQLTYLPAWGKKPTNEWRAIKTVQEAEAIAAAARKKPFSPRNQPPKSAPEKQNPGGGFCLFPGGETPPRGGTYPEKLHPKPPGGETPPTI
jgi:hypothetical protein